jgi:branched-chain amino acid transport system substrate-binding protein
MTPNIGELNLKNTMTTLVSLTLVAGVYSAGAIAADSVKIGMITTLSGPAGYLGEDVRDGFMLAIDEEGGKLGGASVDVVVEDDGLKPENGKAIAERFLEKEKAEIITGIIFSNISPVVAPLTLKAGSFYISPNSGPSIFAGKKCHPDYFVASWQNDTLHEAAGLNANNLGYTNAFILAPNYQAGKDSLAGFKRTFKGSIVDQVYTKLGQTDYAAEIAKIRAAKPQMVFHFLPGGMGINFLKQYAQAGLKDSIPLVLAAPSMDVKIIAAVGDIALGIHNTSHWNHDLDNAANQTFLENFRNKYNREPTVYASQGYDTAKLIASALKATAGKVLADKDAFRAALEKADFESTRGPFKFGNNHHPIHNWYGKVVEMVDGKLVNKRISVVAENHQDSFAKDCAMQR